MSSENGFEIRTVLIFVAILAANIVGSANLHGQETRLAGIFQDNMVLQREKPVPIWGWAAPGAPVEVAFAGQNKKTNADDHGAWKVTLDPLTAERKGQVLQVHAGAAAISCKNVLVGEVWIAAGQSNMIAPGPDLDNGVYPHYVSPGTRGGKPEIRECVFGFGASLDPLSDVDPAGRDATEWKTLQEDPPPAALSLCEYFARVVRDGLDVPVGIVRAAVVGTPQTAWMARETLEGFPGRGGNYYQEVLAIHERAYTKATGMSFADFKKTENTWRQTKAGPWPAHALLELSYPAALYNTRIHPLAPLAIRGVIWHQGEAGPAGPYGARLVAMAKQWRALFGQDFTFIWGSLGRDTTQAPPLTPIRTQFYCSTTNVEIDNALREFAGDKQAALVEFYDLGDHGTHWLQKAEAGRRMGLAALTVAYGQNHIYTGPHVAEMKIAGGKAIVRFDNVGEGLVYQPSINGISGVCLRGRAGPLRWADVKIIGKDTAEISHPDIPDPVSVSYGENANPYETLFNSAGLPASPYQATGATWAGDAATLSLPQLLALQGPKPDALMQIGHVRRSGYVFQLIPKSGKTPSVTLKAYIPAEWKGFVVESGGKPLTTADASTAAGHFVTFSAATDKAWIIVAEEGKAADFRKVNRY